MSATRFQVSLRIRHPQIAPDWFSSKIDLMPSHQWNVGEQKKTPRGQLLAGVNRESYWCAPIPVRNRNLLSASLDEVVDRLSRHASLFREVVESGGRVELFIGCFSDGDWGAELDAAILMACAELSLSLSFDVYSGSDRRSEGNDEPKT